MVWAGRILAVLGSWQMESANGEADITASVVKFDAYLLPRCKMALATLHCGKALKLYEVKIAWDGHELRMHGRRANG